MECKIGELITLEYGKGLRDYRENAGKYEVFGTNGKIGFTENYLYDKPSIVIGRKGAYKGVHLASKPFYVIDTAFYTKAKNGNTDNIFLYYWLKDIDIDAMDSGSAIPSTIRDEVYDLDIALPPLPEQKAIASVLSSLDDKIDLLHRQNKTLEAMAETLFRQWFIEEAQDD
jgi:type I restriction enzyme S subunit